MYRKVYISQNPRKRYLWASWLLKLHVMQLFWKPTNLQVFLKNLASNDYFNDYFSVLPQKDEGERRGGEWGWNVPTIGDHFWNFWWGEEEQMGSYPKWVCFKSNYWLKKKPELFCVILFFGIFALHCITYYILSLSGFYLSNQF